MKIDSIKFGLAFGIVSGLAMALLSVYAMYMKLGLRMVSILGGVFPGYDVSWKGAGLGLVYGLVCTFVYMCLAVLVYDWMVKFKGIKRAKAAGKKKK